MKTTWNPNQKTLSNKTAKAGALAGFTTGAAYLLKNKQELFVDSIKLAKNKGYFDTRFKCEYVAVPLAIIAGTTAVLSALGKVAGMITEKIQAKKMENQIGKMIDDLEAKSLKDLEEPIDYETLDKMLLPQEKIDEIANNPTFKGLNGSMPFYTDSAPDIATINFINEFGKPTSAPVSKQKTTLTNEDIIRALEHDIPVYTDTLDVEMATLGFKELNEYNNQNAYN